MRPALVRNHEQETLMKRKAIAWIAAFCAVAAMAQPGAPSTDAKSFAALMHESMGRMHHGMTAAHASGDPDRAFVRMMIPHHQGAIDMSKALLLYGKDRELQQLAKSIIAEQQNEIQLMQLWLAKHPPSAKSGGK
ncbi:MAG: hypothetical protein NVSMB68_15730 [Thermoanaerobaculia bacterium]